MTVDLGYEIRPLEDTSLQEDFCDVPDRPLVLLNSWPRLDVGLLDPVPDLVRLDLGGCELEQSLEIRMQAFRSMPGLTNQYFCFLAREAYDCLIECLLRRDHRWQWTLQLYLASAIWSYLCPNGVS